MLLHNFFSEIKNHRKMLLCQFSVEHELRQYLQPFRLLQKGESAFAFESEKERERERKRVRVYEREREEVI